MVRPKFKPRHPPPDFELINSLREGAGLSMPAMAKMLEVSAASVESWCYGKNKMPAPVWTLFNLLLNKDKTP